MLTTFYREGKLNTELGSDGIVALESAAQSLNALPHAAETVAFDIPAASAVILNFEPASSIDRQQAQMTIASAGMPNHISHSFAHHERNHAFLSWRETNLLRLRFHRDACGFQRRLGLFEFSVKAMVAISSDGAANFGQSFA